MDVLITCKNEEDPIKNEGARVAKRLYVDFSGAQGQITPKSVVGSGKNSSSFKFFMHVFVICKNEENAMKNEFNRVATTFRPL